jgi:predicted transcriptional regulator
MGVAAVRDDPLTLAERLEQQADNLYEQVRNLRQQAADLRVEATRHERHVTIAPVRPSREPISEASLDKMVDALRELQPTTGPALAEHLGITDTRTRAILNRLAELRVVDRTGVRSDTRWFLRDERPEEHQSNEQKCRDAMVKLGIFTIYELAEEAEVSDQVARNWVKRYEEKGVVTHEVVDRTHLFEYHPPEAGKTQRRRHEAPEKLAVRQFGSITRMRGGQVTSGRNMRTGSTIVNQLIRRVKAADPSIETRKTAHRVDFIKDGQVIANCSSTPGASSLKGTEGQLRQAGVEV